MRRTGTRRWIARTTIAAFAAMALLPVGAPAQAAETRFPILFGNPGDVPLVGNWLDRNDGNDAPDEIGVYRPSTLTFYLRHDFGNVSAIRFGDRGDVPLAGNFDGYSGDEVGIYRPSTSTFHLRMPNDVVQTYRFGNPGDVPLIGSWHGYRWDSIGVYRPSTRQAFLMEALWPNARVDVVNLSTVSGDIPIVMHGSDLYDRVGFYRPSTQTFYPPGGFPTVLGNPGDRPLVGQWTGDEPSYQNLGVYRPSTQRFYRD